MPFVRARTSFAGPDHLIVMEGDVFDADDPVAVTYSAHFEPVEEAAARTAEIVEEATAKPGSTRQASTRRAK